MGAAGDTGCVRTVRAITAGSSPAPGDFAPALACRRSAHPNFRYDAVSGAAVATRDLAVGELLPSVAAAVQVVARKGQDLRLRERIGTVTVERGVTAAQAGRAGQRIFVRTADGAVFSAMIAE